VNWFQRHLNWTWGLAYLLWFVINAYANDPFGIAWWLSLVAAIFWLIVSGWVIKQKGRSLWWILLTPFFSPLWLKNKRLVSQNLPTIPDEDLQELPDNPSWLLKRALRAFDKKHYRLASWLCRIAIHGNPNDYFALCKYAQSLYHLGKANDPKAASIYKRAIEINPTHSLAHAGLGLIHYTNAKRLYRESYTWPTGSWLMFADEKSPENDNERSLSTSYADFQVGNRKIAIKELEEAANLTSDRDDKVELLDMAAEIRCIMGNEDGIKAYKSILHIAPDYVNAHFNLAGCYAATGKCALALQEYKFITERAPELASDLESVLARFNVKIDKEC
jgi:tetratricopeptide (TPR) repeat protein